MSKTLRYRLFKIGAMPEALRAEIKNDQLLFVEEGVAVTVRRKGSGPGFKGGAIGIFSGAFAVTNQRIVASISSTVMVNAPYAGKDASGAEVSLAEDGLHVAVDASIHPRWTGEIQMHFKQNFSETELARFPCRKILFQFPADLVPKMFGVPA